jgi:hypothetical protein
VDRGTRSSPPEASVAGHDAANRRSQVWKSMWTTFRRARLEHHATEQPR